MRNLRVIFADCYAKCAGRYRDFFGVSHHVSPAGVLTIYDCDVVGIATYNACAWQSVMDHGDTGESDANQKE